MTYRESILIKCLLIALIFLSFASPLNAQDSVLYQWDDLVRDPKVDEVNLLQLAQVSSLELQMMALYAEVCQQFQPESEETAEKPKSHIFEIGKNVQEYLNRYTEEEIIALGIPNNRPQDFLELQKEEISKLIREYPEDLQKSICSEYRTDILNTAPAAKVERFKK